MKTVKVKVNFEVVYYVEDHTNNSELIWMSEDLISSELPDNWELGENEEFTIEILESNIVV